METIHLILRQDIFLENVGHLVTRRDGSKAPVYSVYDGEFFQSNIKIQFENDGSAFFMNSVGIGTTNPTAKLDVDGTLNVSGVSTFTGAADFNGDVDVDGHTELDDLNVSIVTTTAGLLDINAGAQANTLKVEDLTDNRVVIAGSGGELEDDANLTFNGTQLAVGVDLDVDGHTELDNLNVSGVSTFQDNVKLTTDNKKLIFGSGEDLEIFHDGSNNFILSNNGSFNIKSSFFKYLNASHLTGR